MKVKLTKFKKNNFDRLIFTLPENSSIQNEIPSKFILSLDKKFFFEITATLDTAKPPQSLRMNSFPKICQNGILMTSDAHIHRSIYST